MHRDVKEIVGVLMRVLGGGEVSRAEVMDLSFEADGELLVALNEAYIKLLEFAHDREEHGDAFGRARDGLLDCLNKVIAACDRTPDCTAIGKELRGIKASHQMEFYDAGVVYTLTWASHEDYAAGKKLLTEMGAACGRFGDIKPGAPEFFVLDDHRQREALSALRKELRDRRRR